VSTLSPEIHAAFQRCIASVNSMSADCSQSFAMLSSLCMNIGILNENSERRLFLLLAFALPLRQLGERLQAFRTKLRVFEAIGSEFPCDLDTITKYHSKATGEIVRSLETLEGLIESEKTDYEGLMSELLVTNKYLYGLQEKIGFMNRIFGDIVSRGNQGA
jgi:hypothetical protein